jgi:hypothetical protein
MDNCTKQRHCLPDADPIGAGVPVAAQKDPFDCGYIFPFVECWTPIFADTGEINALNSDSQEICRCCNEYWL